MEAGFGRSWSPLAIGNSRNLSRCLFCFNDLVIPIFLSRGVLGSCDAIHSQSAIGAFTFLQTCGIL